MDGSNDGERVAVGFSTANGKGIFINKESLESAMSKMEVLSQKSDAFSLSQSFIETVSSASGGGDDEMSIEVDDTPPGGLVLLVTKIHEPIFFLPKKNYYVSRYAVRKMEQFNAAFQINVPEDESPIEALSFLGLEEGSVIATRVIALKTHCTADLREGGWYRLKGFQPRMGNENQLLSTEGCTIASIVRTPLTLSPPEIITLASAQEISRSWVERVDVDIVVRVLDVRTQTVVVQDIDGDVLNLIFMFGVDTEGLEDLLRVDKVLAICDVQVRPTVTSKRGIIFVNPYTKFFADAHIPSHLSEVYQKLKEELLSAPEKPVSQKRPAEGPAEDEEPQAKRPALDDNQAKRSAGDEDQPSDRPGVDNDQAVKRYAAEKKGPVKRSDV